MESVFHIQIILMYWMLGLLHAGTPAVQQLNYEILKNGKPVGKLVSTQTVGDGTKEFITESDVSIEILFKIQVYTRVRSLFNNGLLFDGNFLRKVNGREKANAHIYWANDKYYIKGLNETEIFKSKIYYTTACLMHVEPEGLGRIFSENFRRFIPIKPVGPHKYVLQLPDGNENYYTYSNGKCVEAEIETSFATVHIHLKN